VSERSVIHQRTVYKLLDYIGDIGGFHDALLLLIEFVMAYYSPTFFTSSAIKTFFQIDRYLPSSSSHFLNRRYVNPHHSKNEANDKLQQLRKALIAKLTKSRNRDNNLPDLQRETQVDKTDLMTLIKMIAKRSKYKLGGFSTLIGQHFACFKRFYKTKTLKQQVAFEKGASRVEEVLEIKSLLETQADLKIIKQVLFTRHQQHLIQMQRNRVISLESSSSDSDSGGLQDEFWNDRQEKKVSLRKHLRKFKRMQ